MHFSSDRVLIELQNYPDIEKITEENIKCDFKEDSFNLEISIPNSIDSYALNITKTREIYDPSKSKFYLRKGKLYVALQKLVPKSIFEFIN